MKKTLSILFIIFYASYGWTRPLSVDEVAPGIFVHFSKHQLPDTINHGAIANIGFIIGKRCVAVIDTGGNPDEGRALREAIRKQTDKSVCYVINTHVHPDHIYGNSAFKQDKPRFIGHHNLARAINSRASFYIARAPEQLGINLTEADLVVPDKGVKKHLVIDIGDRKLMLTAHPTAHTDNDLTVYDQQTDTMWLSDLLFLEHIPIIDGSLKGWIAVMERLGKKSYQRVIPGHGPLVTHWPEAMQAQHTYLNVLLKEIRIFIKQGGFLEDAVTRIGYSQKNKWHLFDDFHKKNVTTSFAELEWED